MRTNSTPWTTWTLSAVRGWPGQVALPMIIAACSSAPVSADDTRTPKQHAAAGEQSAGDVAGFLAVRAPSGAESYVHALDEQGDVVVGFVVGDQGEQAFRFSKSEGLRLLEGAASQARAVSSDGSLVTGSFAEPSIEQGRAAVLWRSSEAPTMLEGPRVPGGAPIFWIVEGRAVLDDGRVFGTCLQYRAYGEPLACRYDAQGKLEVFSPGHVYAADAEGNFAGTRSSERHAPFTSVATFNDEALPFPAGTTCAPTTGCRAAARGFAEGGANVVGTATLPWQGPSNPDAPALVETAFIYSEEEGMLRLDDIEGGELASGAYAVSRDGRTIAGFGTDARGQVAVVWVERKPRRLADLVREAGGALPDGFALLDVRAVSAEGRVFAGNGVNADGVAEGYRIELPSAP